MNLLKIKKIYIILKYDLKKNPHVKLWTPKPKIRQKKNFEEVFSQFLLSHLEDNMTWKTACEHTYYYLVISVRF